MHRFFIALAVAGLTAAPPPVLSQPPAKQGAAHAAVRYVCPMTCEGDKTYDAPGKCPVCHMNLKAMAAGPTLDIQSDGPIKAGEPAKLTLTVRDSAGGAMAGLDAAPAQLVIVARDLSWFTRPAPRQLERSAVSITQTLTPGEYRAFVNASPASGEPIQASAVISVAGKPPVPKAAGVDADRPKTVEGVTVWLDGAKGLVAGREATLTYHLTRDGKPAADLKPQSGDHLTAVSLDLQQCVHADGVQGHSSSDPAFMVRLDRPGLYRLWAEFPRGEHSILAPFTVEVSAAAGK